MRRGADKYKSSGRNRNRMARPRTVNTQDDNLTERKRIERQWEQSINFFADSGKDDGTNTNERKGE